MSDATFQVPCNSCGRAVIIDSVSEFYCAGNVSGYSYAVRCECGSNSEVDGVDADRIPESMRRDAAVRHQAVSVQRTVNFQRRELARSPGKELLKGARLAIPRPLSDAKWHVYTLPCESIVGFCPIANQYFLLNANNVREFANVSQLARYLERENI